MKNFDGQVEIARNKVEDEIDWTALRRSVKPGAELPEWPFEAAGGRLLFCHWDDVLSGDFAYVLRNLGQRFGESHCYLSTFAFGGRREGADGKPSPVLKLRIEGLGEQNYYDIINEKPGGDYGPFPVWPGRDVVAATGPSGKWAVWAEWELEVCIIRTESVGDWVHAGVGDEFFVGLDLAIDSFMSMALDGKIPDDLRRAMVRNFS